MSVIHITQQKQKFMHNLPYWLLINDKPLGIMRDKADVQLPNGNYKLGIWLRFMLWKWELRLGKDFCVKINDEDISLEFWHSEPVWDFIFNIDLALWFITFFITIPHPWNIIYHIFSDGFFLIWLVRQYIKRNDYLRFKCTSHEN